jgi:hypothetical protein
VASQTSTERGVLGLHRRMPRASTPVVAGLLGPSQARPPRLAPHPPVPCTGTCPIQRAPQKVQGGGTLAMLWRLGRRPAGQHPRFGRGEGPSAAPQPLAQDRPHSPCIVLALEPDEDVSTRANQRRLPLKPWLHLGITPPVEPIVSGDVPHQGCDYTAYKVATLPIEFSTSIPRTQLRPGYEDGFLGAPLQRVPPYEHPSPRAQGGERGTSRTPPQDHPGGAHHV